MNRMGIQSRLFLGLALFFWPICSFAQTFTCKHFDELIQAGNAYYKTGNYLDALYKFQVAGLTCPEGQDKVQGAIEQVFRRIEQLRKDAVKAQQEAVSNGLKVEAEKTKTEFLLTVANQTIIEKNRLIQEVRSAKDSASANEKAARVEVEKNKRLLESIWFYDNQYAVGQHVENGSRAFFFMNREGYRWEKLGIWDLAQPFDSMCGLAWVKKSRVEYVIDTLGRKAQYTSTIKNIDNDFEALYLGQRYLKHVPQVVWDQYQLKILILRSNSLRNLSWEIGRLKRLRLLDLSGNSLKTLPQEIRHLRDLEALFLESNDLIRLPAQIGNLAKLKELVLSDNDLVELPEEIGFLKELQHLDLTKNKLQDLPFEIGSLSKLKTLRLQRNFLHEIPSEIGKLSGLEILDLSANQLATLPPVLERLKSLKQLDLRNNDFTRTDLQKATVLQQLSIWLPNCEVIL